MPDRKLIPGAVYLERGQPVTVLAAWSGRGPRNVAIKRSDGAKVVRPFRGLRKFTDQGGESAP